jgi:DNA-binding Xre family transcriptional regulator
MYRGEIASSMIRLKIKEIARQKGISQGKLSHMAFVDAKTLRRIYHDPVAFITTDTLNRVANALQVHPCELFDYEPDLK